MHDHLLVDIGKATIAAAALGLPAYYLKIPLMLAYLLAGVLLGNHLGFGFIKGDQNLSTISEFGLILLMFILGLEINIKKLIQAGRPILINGVTQFWGCLILAYLFFGLLGYSHKPFDLLYIAVAVSMSSTLAVVRILADRMNIDALPSRITLGILVFQDLWAIAFLALQPNLNSLDVTQIFFSLTKLSILVVSTWFAARNFLPSVFASIGKHSELMLIVAMGWCFSVCALAGYLQLSLEMGALVSGVSIASYPYHQDIAARISSLRNFFITLFFVGLGLQIPMPTREVLGLTGWVILFVTFSRVITVFPVLHFLKFGNRASLIPAVNLSQLSEFSLVLASLGVAYGHISPELMPAFVLSMAFTAFLSSALIPNAHTIYQILNPILEKMGFKDSVSTVEPSSVKTENPASIVFLGFYREASSLLYELKVRYSKSIFSELLIVDFNPEAHVKLEQEGIQCRYGDVGNFETLSNFQIGQAKLIICTIPDQALRGTTNRKLLRTLKQIAPNSKIIVTAEQLEEAKAMYAEGADYVYIPRLVSAYFLADLIERIRAEGFEKINTGGISFLKDRVEIIP